MTIADTPTSSLGAVLLDPALPQAAALRASLRSAGVRAAIVREDDGALLEHAARLGVAPAAVAVITDAAECAEAADLDGFGLILGVGDGARAGVLLARGAHRVVADARDLDREALDAALRETAAISQRVVQDGFDPAREHEVESLFALSNGHLGLRGALETPLPASRGDLFLAGVFDRDLPEPVERGLVYRSARDDVESDLVRLPSPLRFRLTAGDRPLDLSGDLWRAHRRVLDLRRALLRAEMRFELHGGRHLVTRTLRCVSAADRHLLLQEIRVCTENHAARLELEAALPSLGDPGVDAPHVVALRGDAPGGVDLRAFATKGSGHRIAVAARTTHVGTDRGDGTRWQVDARLGEEVVFRRVVAIFTTRDVDDPIRAAVERARAWRWEDFEAALSNHVARWAATWARAGVRVEGDDAAEQALRFQAYHLTAAAGDDERVSVGARGLTGRAYDGHVFWDVEIFMLPFHVHTAPEVARSRLRYRVHTLDGARDRARALGHPGACFAWESTVTGRDVTPREVVLAAEQLVVPVLTGEQQLHVTADVAHALWRYVEATGDTSLLVDGGVEILVETARFWVDRCVEAHGARHLRGVIGPDEYHHSVEDNAYTNWMVRRNLEHAVEAAAWLARAHPSAWGALAERCGLGADEPEAWAEVARTLVCPGPDARGVIEQFAGFFELEDHPIPPDERFGAPITRVLDPQRVNGLKVLKQADVLMLLHLLPDLFPREVVLANYRYYEPLTDHGSSLSPPVHAAVAARLGLRDDAERYWRRSLELDLSDVMGNAALGVHLASMGGTWQALVFGFLGVRFGPDGPRVDPDAASRLPRTWRRVATRLAWRGRLHDVEVVASGEATS